MIHNLNRAILVLLGTVGIVIVLPGWLMHAVTGWPILYCIGGWAVVYALVGAVLMGRELKQ
jgi:hypothetical protein